MAYFTEQRKGEINDLRNLLQQAQLDRNDEEKQRESIKKVIAAMTLGMDVSPLFSEMIMASNTRDLVVKKMVYLYLTHHAREHPETALLAINTLLKDYADDSPMVRGLALRALASLRQRALVEHVILPLKSGLVDVSPYVRRTAVLGCAKVFQLAPDTIKDPAIINKLYEMLRDKDPQVMVNAAVTLDEILRSDGRGNLDLSPSAGIQLNKKLALHLMERLSALDQWGQCLILDYLVKYLPDEDELFPFMNMLDTRLQSIHVSVVFAVIKLFLAWTTHIPDVHRAVYARVKQPLLLLMHAQHAELHAGVLHHIKLITHHVPDLFAHEFKRFYCRVSDPPYLRRLKIDILTAVADAENGAQIIDELSEYVHDRHVTVAHQAVLAIGRVGEVTPVTERAVTALTAVLDYFEARDLNQGHARDLRDAALIALADICRVRPESSVLSCVPRVLTIAARDRQLSPATLTAVASLLGGPAAVLDESPYAAEDWARHVTDFDASSLTAFGHSATALMLKRPAEVKPWLGGLLENCIERPESNALARDQATWLYNLLSLDVGLAKQVLFTEQAINRFAEDQPLEIIDRLFEEFNSLSVIYGEPSERFIETRAVSDTLQDLVQDSDSEEEEDEDSDEEHVTPVTDHVTPVGGQQVTAVPQTSVSFKAQVSLDAKSFEGHWKTLKECGSVQLDTQLTSDKPQSVVESMESQLKAQRLHVMAKGVVKQVIKFYLYTQLESSDMLVLIEMIVDLTQQRLTAKFKSPNLDPDYLRQFLLHFQSVITPLVK